MKSSKNEGIPFANVLAGVGLVPGPRVSVNDQNNSGVVNKNESSDTLKQENARNSENTTAGGMKKNEKFIDSSKISGSIPSASVEGPNTSIKLDKSRTSRRKVSTRSASPTSQGGNDTESTLSNISDPGHASASEQFIISEQSNKGSAALKVETTIASEANSSMAHSVIVSSASAVPSENSSTQVQLSQSVPHRAVSPLIISASTSGSSQIHTDQAKSSYDEMYQSVGKESNRPLPSAVPAKKPRRGRAPKVSAPVVPDSPPSSPDSAGVEQQPKRRKKASKSTPSTNDEKHRLSAPINRGDNFMTAHMNQQASQVTENVRKDSPSLNQLPRENFNANKAQEPPAITSLPTTLPGTNAGTKDLNPCKDNPSSFIHGKENSHYLIRNGITAPHMLGNQLNPNSSVAQKMTDTLVAEVEAHSVTDESSTISSTSLVGVPFPLRTVSPSLKLPPSSGAPSFPHSLEQLLERQWEQGSQFLMEQAQHFDSKTFPYRFQCIL
jgi:hypothetical protein